MTTSPGPTARLILDRQRREATIVINADCDIAMVAEVERLLREAAAAEVRRIELDFAGVGFADSAAVHLAFRARGDLEPTGGEVVIKTPPWVQRIFDLTHTTGQFMVIPTS